MDRPLEDHRVFVPQIDHRPAILSAHGMTALRDYFPRRNEYWPGATSFVGSPHGSNPPMLVMREKMNLIHRDHHQQFYHHSSAAAAEQERSRLQFSQHQSRLLDLRIHRQRTHEMNHSKSETAAAVVSSIYQPLVVVPGSDNIKNNRSRAQEIDSLRISFAFKPADNASFPCAEAFRYSNSSQLFMNTTGGGTAAAAAAAAAEPATATTDVLRNAAVKAVARGSKQGEPKSRKRKHSEAESTNKTSSVTTSSSHPSALLKGPAVLAVSGMLRGERRLIIHFESYGSKGLVPQGFGKSGHLLPDGLRGRHTLYHEQWKFSITHGEPRTRRAAYTAAAAGSVVCITWTIIHERTGLKFSRTETEEEATERILNGRTISNHVFREALKAQVQLLMDSQNDGSNQARQAERDFRIKTLQPRCFNQGLLVFGLQHKIVQDKMKD